MAAVETTRKLYDAWHAGDMLSAMSLMSEDIVLTVWPNEKQGVPMSGVWKTKVGVSQYFKVRTALRPEVYKGCLVFLPPLLTTRLWTIGDGSHSSATLLMF